MTGRKKVLFLGKVLFIPAFLLIVLSCFMISAVSGHAGTLKIGNHVSSDIAQTGISANAEIGDGGTVTGQMEIPIILTVKNTTAAEFNGSVTMTLASQSMDSDTWDSLSLKDSLFYDEKTYLDGYDGVFHFIWNVTVPVTEEAHITVKQILPEYSGTIRLQIKNQNGAEIYSADIPYSLDSAYENYFFAGCFADDPVRNQLKEGTKFTLNGQERILHIVSLVTSSLENSLSMHNPEILFISSDYFASALTKEEREQLGTWEQHGGTLVVENNFTEDSIKEAVSSSHTLAKRDYEIQNQDYFRMLCTELLKDDEEDTEGRLLFTIGLLLLFAMLAGPVLWHMLHWRRNTYPYFNIASVLSFVLILGIFGLHVLTSSTAPQTYSVRSIFQKDSGNVEKILFDFYTPSPDSATFYVEPESQLFPVYIGEDAMQEWTNEDSVYFNEVQKVSISYQSEQTEVVLENQPAASDHIFEVKLPDSGSGKMEVTCSFCESDLEVTLDNQTENDYKSGIVLTPGGIYVTGPVKKGESLSMVCDCLYSLSSLQDSSENDSLYKLLGQDFASYLQAYTTCYLVNRGEDIVWIGELENSQSDYWLDSGYRHYEKGYYIAPADLCTGADGWIDSNWAGTCFTRNPETDPVPENGTISMQVLNENTTDMYYDLTACFGQDTVIGGILFTSAIGSHNFNGTVELFNRRTGEYDALQPGLDSWIPDYQDYIENGLLKVRYTRTAEPENTHIYAPVLIIKEKGGEGDA